MQIYLSDSLTMLGLILLEVYLNSHCLSALGKFEILPYQITVFEWLTISAIQCKTSLH